MKKVILAWMVIVASSAFAGDAPYAKLVAISGNVTIATKSQMVAATVGMPLSQGAAVLPGSSATATVLFASGCQASVGSGQTLSIDAAACAALNAKARTVQGSAGSMATGGEAELTGLSTGAIVGGALATAVIINEVTKGDGNGGNSTPNKPISNQ